MNPSFKSCRILFQFLIIFLISPVNNKTCLAQNIIYVSGTYPGTTIWSADTVKVIDWVSTDTLIIEPGTVVEFQSEYGLYAEKYLYANGAIGDTILFTKKDTTGFSDPNLSTGGWGGIGGRNVKLNYCKIQYVKKFNRNGSAVNAVYLLDMQNSSIINNRTIGIYSEFNKLKINKSIISNNTGGGIFARYSTNLFLENSTVELNGNYGIKTSETYSFYVNNCKIQSNIGNGIEIHDLEAIWRGMVANSKIQFNDGFGFLGDICGIHFVNNLVLSNSKAGIRQMMGFGAGTVFINNTIIKNSNGIVMDEGPLYMYNSICRDNGQQNISCVIPETILLGKIYNSNIEGINPDDFNGEFMNNIDTDPLFIDTANYDFHLVDSSPCINTGTPDTTGLFLPVTDLDGKSRISNGWIDMGALEASEFPGNQPPLIEWIHDQVITPGTIISINAKYIDPDPGDHPFVLGVNSDNPAIRIKDLVDNSSSVDFNMVVNPEWQQENCEIQIEIMDDHGIIGVQKFHVLISEEVCGKIFENTTWDCDTVKVTCDVTVSEFATLTVKPGTVVVFANNCGLIIDGSIVAIGNRDSVITFTSIDTTGFINQTYKGWKGISFNGGVKAEFRYCDFLYVNNSHALYLQKRDKSPTLITKCNFYNNYSPSSGGAIYLSGGVAEIKNCVFFDNRAKYKGGAICFRSTKADISNNLFFKNQGDIGGAIYSDYGNVRLINNTIVANKAQRMAGGAYIAKGEILNCIFWGNESGVLNDQVTVNDKGSVGNCIIERGVDGINLKGTALVISGPVFSDEPAFVNKSLFDFHQTDTSVGINSGTIDTSGLNLPGYDLDGNPRVFDGRIDIGAFEYPMDNFHILKQPVSQVICAGREVIFETEAIGGVAGYQWQKDGSDIPFAVHRSLYYDPVFVYDTGYYNCLIFADDKTYSTDTIFLSVDTDFIIENQSDSLSICSGKDTYIHVTTSGGKNQKYEWTKNDTILRDASESELLISSPALNQQDVYLCTISNTCGSVVSDKIKVTASIIPDPPVSKDTSVCEGQPVPDLTAPGNNVIWYSDSLLSNPVHSGNNFNTGQSAHGIYVYYATQSVCGCESAAGTVTLTIHELPVISLGKDSAILSSQSFVLGPYPDSFSYLWNDDSQNPFLEISGNDLGNGIHTIWVSVTDTNTCQMSDTLIVQVIPFTNINSTQYNSRLCLFPNPTDGLLNIEISDFPDKDIKVKLYNQHGEIFLSDKTMIDSRYTIISLNLSSFPRGIYYLQVICHHNTYLSKVVVK